MIDGCCLWWWLRELNKDLDKPIDGGMEGGNSRLDAFQLLPLLFSHTAALHNTVYVEPHRYYTITVCGLFGSTLYVASAITRSSASKYLVEGLHINSTTYTPPPQKDCPPQPLITLCSFNMLNMASPSPSRGRPSIDSPGLLSPILSPSASMTDLTAAYGPPRSSRLPRERRGSTASSIISLGSSLGTIVDWRSTKDYGGSGSGGNSSCMSYRSLAPTLLP